MQQNHENYYGYLFAHVMKNDYGRLYYSISKDGLNWKQLNNGKRILGDEYYGHPNITRGHDERFYLLGGGDPVITIWVSNDLIAWTKLLDYDPDVPNAVGFKKGIKHHGAPKCFYDSDSEQYIMTWHSPSKEPVAEEPERVWNSMRTYYVISRDMLNFSEPQRLFDFPFATIDVIICKEGKRYYAFLKDERWADLSCPTGKTIRMSSSYSLTKGYSEPTLPISPNWREAPTLIKKLDDSGWYLYYEEYPGVSYGCSTSNSLDGAWFNLQWQTYKVPEGVRHGGMIEIYKKEYNRLISAYGGEQEY